MRWEQHEEDPTKCHHYVRCVRVCQFCEHSLKVVSGDIPAVVLVVYRWGGGGLLFTQQSKNHFEVSKMKGRTKDISELQPRDCAHSTIRAIHDSRNPESNRAQILRTPSARG
jgi:hypothetical protein